MELNPADLQDRDIYKLLTGAVIPRPIAWVSTLNGEGQPNLAPFSFFNVVCSNPPTLLFCPGTRGTDGSLKDTLRNIQTTGEFVVNVVTEALAAQMNITATELPPHVNEFERAGLTTAPSVKIAAPRVSESPINLECTLNQIITINPGPGGGSIVIGTVVYMHFDDRVYQEGHYINLEAYEAVGRLTGAGYSRTRDQFQLKRLPPEL